VEWREGNRTGKGPQVSPRTWVAGNTAVTLECCPQGYCSDTMFPVYNTCSHIVLF